MAVSKFDQTNQGFLELIADGLSFKDACREMGVQEKTVRNWLAKGRGGDERYAEFAAIFEASKEEVAQREEPVDRDELMLAVSKAVRKGSVQAMKLMEEMLRRGTNDDSDEQPSDPFADLDGVPSLDEARARRAG